jgi:hypothetical protein
MGRTHLQQLLSLLDFWRVSYPGKALYVWWIPLGVGGAAALAFFYAPQANIAHDRGLLDVSSGLLSMLVGFFVAALGLALTLTSESLDKEAKANGPKFGDRTLTWRAFARTVTAYLVLVSLCTYLIAVGALMFHPTVELMNNSTRAVVRILVGGVYVAMFTHVISVTTFALFLISNKLPEVAEPAPLKRPPTRKRVRRNPTATSPVDAGPDFTAASDSSSGERAEPSQ